MPTTTTNAMQSKPASIEAAFHGACEKSARSVISAIRRAATSAQNLSTPLGEIENSLTQVIEQTATLLLAGKTVRIIEEDETLTTQQAADLLNVSRPYLVQLLDKGVIPQLPKAGRHRRVAHSAIVAYKRRRDAEKAAALGELAALSQAHGMGY
jgi:excisionase family DNA binding protein